MLQNPKHVCQTNTVLQMCNKKDAKKASFDFKSETTKEW